MIPFPVHVPSPMPPTATFRAAMIKLLQLGASRPWQDALFEVTGQREMDASAILEYFAPLQKWLEEQNKGQNCGWE